MPKLKTHSGTKKRVRKTATGKLTRQRAYTGHFLAKKSASQKRVNSKSHVVNSSNVKNIKRALGA